MERESWQLELLVSAFTIFLLIQANIAFDSFMVEVEYQYNFESNLLVFMYIFLGLLNQALKALTFFLIAHLMLRGFWIGTIGLRSVQSEIDFGRLNYSDFFTKKLKEKVISLDQLVMKLDEICSVVFAFAFLIMSVLLSFGLYLLIIGILSVFADNLFAIIPDWLDTPLTIVWLIIMLTYLVSGVIYMIDYFTLGFFKKLKWFGKVYYPFYRFYQVITIASLSRSIYYYMISKFTKKKIRILYTVCSFIILSGLLFMYDQFQFSPEKTNDFELTANVYEDKRKPEDYIDRVSISSDFIDQPHFPVFLRYRPDDNALIKAQCDYEPVKSEGLNFQLKFDFTEKGLSIGEENFEDENIEKMLECRKSIFKVFVNDSLYTNLNYYFYKHPGKNQRGLQTVIPATAFISGENVLSVQKLKFVTMDSTAFEEYARVPFWYSL